MNPAPVDQRLPLWADLLERCQHDVARARDKWNRSPQLKAMGPPPTMQDEREYADEDELMWDVIVHLRKRGLTVEHMDSGSKSQTARARAGRPSKGWPDITVFCPGARTVFLETKTEEGKLSPDQIKKHAELERLGFRVGVVRTKRAALEFVFWEGV